MSFPALLSNCWGKERGVLDELGCKRKINYVLKAYFDKYSSKAPIKSL
jgi:hypothetical protein